MTEQNDLFKTRIKLDPSNREASQLMAWAMREGAITYILKEIEDVRPCAARRGVLQGDH
jgi:hypothetical protein